MGTAFYPVLDSDIPGYEPATMMSGKALADSIGEIDDKCTHLGLPLLSGFVSDSAAEAFEMVGEEMPDDIGAIPCRWFDPTVGLRTVRGLLSHAAQQSDSSLDDALMRDLSALEQILLKAIQHNLRFRLRIDI